MTKDQILAEAKSLNPDEQDELADAIWMLAHGVSQKQIEAMWATEIQDRVNRADRGEGSSSPVDEVISRLRQKAPR